MMRSRRAVTQRVVRGAVPAVANAAAVTQRVVRGAVPAVANAAAAVRVHGRRAAMQGKKSSPKAKKIIKKEKAQKKP
jgi:hypothetical protein